MYHKHSLHFFPIFASSYLSVGAFDIAFAFLLHAKQKILIYSNNSLNIKKTREEGGSLIKLCRISYEIQWHLINAYK
jgi:hypothetical protein